jgi:hypothetical protein
MSAWYFAETLLESGRFLGWLRYEHQSDAISGVTGRICVLLGSGYLLSDGVSASGAALPIDVAIRFFSLS